MIVVLGRQQPASAVSYYYETLFLFDDVEGKA